jgi:hypothetical protein
MRPRDLIFVSYCHLDKEWLDRLDVYFKSFPWGVSYKQGGRLWADPYIRTGDRWRREIGEGLDRARIGVLLVSQDFLASAFVREVELPTLLGAAAAGELHLVCVPIRSSVVDLAGPELVEYQWALPYDQPLAGLGPHEREAALNRAFREIYAIAWDAGLLQTPVAASTPRPPALPPVVSPALTPVQPMPGGSLPPLVGVPEQRPHFVRRPKLRERIRTALLAENRGTVGLSGSRRIGLFGQGGLGKTVAAIDLVEDEELRRSFPDGVFWLTLGQTPDLVGLQSRLIKWTCPGSVDSYAFEIVTGDTLAVVGGAGAGSVSEPRQPPGGAASASTSASITARRRSNSAGLR